MKVEVVVLSVNLLFLCGLVFLNIRGARDFSMMFNDVGEVVQQQQDIIREQRCQIGVLEKNLNRDQVVLISFYHPESRGINSDKDPGRVASMRRPVVGRTVAVSTELFNLGWFDSKIYVEGFGVFVAEDRMAVGVKGKRIDICVESKQRALTLGIKRGVKAVKLIED